MQDLNTENGNGGWLPGWDRPVRVVFQQPSLAKYRLAFFQSLARDPGLDVHVVYGDLGDISNVSPEGFTGEMQHLFVKRKGLIPTPLYWHWPQWTLASGRRADVLVLMWNAQYVTLVPALLRARWNRVGTVLWGHGHSKTDSRIRSRIRNFPVRLADCTMFYDSQSRDECIEKHGFRRDRCFVAPNSMDQSSIEGARVRWTGDPERLQRFQYEQGIDPKQTLLFVSRMHPDNRLELLLEAMRSLVADFPRLKLVLVGKGDGEISRISGLAGQWGLLDHLKVVGPVYEEDQLAPWFLSARALCYPQNIGLTVLHAFGYGLPVVTSDGLNGPEIVALRSGENGFQYPLGDVQAFAGHIRTLLSDDSVHARLSAGALAAVREKYNTERMVAGAREAIACAATTGRGGQRA